MQFTVLFTEFLSTWLSLLPLYSVCIMECVRGRGGGMIELATPRCTIVTF